jgi:hypothetical protein
MKVFSPSNRHRGNIGPSLRLGQREGGDGGTCGNTRQIVVLELLRAGKRDGSTAEALHRKGKVREAAVTGERFAGHHQVKRLERVVRAAVSRRDALPEPAGGAKRTHPAPARRVNVAMARIAAFYVGHRLKSPLVEVVGEGTVLRVEKRNAQVRGPAHVGLLPDSPSWRRDFARKRWYWLR